MILRDLTLPNIISRLMSRTAKVVLRKLTKEKVNGLTMSTLFLFKDFDSMEKSGLVYLPLSKLVITMQFVHMHKSSSRRLKSSTKLTKLIQSFINLFKEQDLWYLKEKWLSFWVEREADPAKLTGRNYILKLATIKISFLIRNLLSTYKRDKSWKKNMKLPL
jgi:hypothetical protein